MLGKSNYKDAIFYVMSGTGNTYRLAGWMQEIITRYNGTSKVVMIEDAEFDNELKQPLYSLVGLLFPTHGFMPPWSMTLTPM